MSALVHKLHNNNGAGDAYQWPPFTDEQSDVLAQVIATVRSEMRAELQSAIAAAVAQLHNEADVTEAVAELRGQMAVLLSLVGNGDLGSNGKNRSRKAKSVSEQVIRKVTVTNP
jgi:hypothetical protein